jgi:hypothetical protein
MFISGRHILTNVKSKAKFIMFLKIVQRENTKYFDPITNARVPEVNRLFIEYLTKQGIVQEPDDVGVVSASGNQPFGVSDDNMLLLSTLPPIQEMDQAQAQELEHQPEQQQMEEENEYYDSDDNNGGLSDSQRRRGTE